MLSVLIEPMFLMLLAAGAVYLLLGDRVEAIALLVAARGRVHSFNNHFLEYGFSGARVSNQGHLVSERNIYETSAADGPALISRAGGTLSVAGHYRSIEDAFLGAATLDTDNDPAPVFAPGDFYAHVAQPADGALAAELRANAGWQDTPLPM